MKRKRILFAGGCMFLLTAICGTGACAPAAERKGNNPEFAEYKRIITTVIDDSLAQMSQPKSQNEKKSAVRPIGVTTEEKNEIFDILGSAPDRKEADVRNFFQDAFEQSLYIPLICGDVITTAKNAEKFYGVTCRMEAWNQSVMTESSGTSKISYVYTSQTGSFQSETFIVMETDYRSEKDYAFRCLQFTFDYSEMLFLYGNSNGDFLAINQSAQHSEGGSEDGGYVEYSHDGEEYMLKDEATVAAAHAVIAEQFYQADIEKIRRVGSHADYNITEKEWAAAASKYFGNSNPEPGVPSWIYDDEKSGVCGEYLYENGQTDTLTIPSDITALTDDFRILADIRKLVIPKTVTALKIRKSKLDALLADGKEEAVTKDNYVDCPLEYFSIEAYAVRSVEDGSRTDVPYAIQEIEVEAGSPLFTVIDGNLWSADGKILLYICDSPAAETLNLHGKEYSKKLQFGQFGARRYLSRYKNVAYDLVDIPDKESGTVFQYDLFRELVRGAADNGNLSVVDLESFSVYNCRSGEDGCFSFDAFCSASALHLYGNFDSVNFRDEEGFAEEVLLHSDTNPNPEFTSGSQFGGVKSLTIRANGEWIENNYPNLEKLIVEEGVTSAVFHLTLQSPAVDIYLPSTLQKISLPYYDIPQEIREDKAAAEAFRRNHRVHLDWLTKDVFEAIRIYERWELSYSQAESGDGFYLGDYLIVFSEEDGEISQLLSNFPYIDRDEGDTLGLMGYYGKDSVIDVPTEYLGRTVISFNLFNRRLNFPEPTVKGVVELRLPATLTEFFFSNNEEGERYSFERVTYAGTKAELISIMTSSDLRSLLEAVSAIQCSDGEYSGEESLHFAHEIYTFQDSLGGLLTVQVDWRNAEEDEKPEGGEKFETQSILFASYTYKGVLLEGHAQQHLDLYGENGYSLRVELREYEILANFYDGIENFRFEQLSVAEAKEPIAHTTATRVKKATCQERGRTELYCTECEAVLSRTDFTPQTEHAFQEARVIPPTCTRKGYTERICTLCGGAVRSDYTEPLGHDFDESGNCTRCRAVKGSDAETKYIFKDSSGGVLTVRVVWEGWSTEEGEFLPVVYAYYVYGEIVFEGLDTEKLMIERNGCCLTVYADRKEHTVLGYFSDEKGNHVDFSLEEEEKNKNE